MGNMTTRPIASAAERDSASTYVWAHTGSAPSADRRILATDILMKDAGGFFSTTNQIRIVNTGEGLRFVGAGAFQTFYNTANTVRAGYLGHFGTDLAINNDLAGAVSFGTSNVERMRISSTGHVLASADNAYTMGGAANRWSVVYAATGSINTSDEREKTWRGALTDAEYAAGREIFAELGFYQWTDEVERKGPDNARYHFGARAQKVWKICATHGLAPKIRTNGKPENAIAPPAFLCWDEWDQQTEPEFEDVETEFDQEEVAGTGKFVEVEGKEYELTEIAMRKAMRVERRATGRDLVRTKAGHRYGFRVDELNSFLIAVQSRRQEELEARIAAMEPAP